MNWQCRLGWQGAVHGRSNNESKKLRGGPHDWANQSTRRAMCRKSLAIRCGGKEMVRWSRNRRDAGPGLG